MGSLLPRLLATLVLSLSPTLALASDNSVFVEQVATQDSPQASERQVASFSTPGSGPVELERLDLPRLSSHEGQGTLSVATQRGRQNRLSVEAVGSGNVTLQRQQGVGLVSEITLIGQRNAIAVDQSGIGLDSNIQVIGGNKLIFHVQRGTGSNAHHQPLIYTGTQREAEVILDTPKGRLSKSLAN